MKKIMCIIILLMPIMVSAQNFPGADPQTMQDMMKKAQEMQSKMAEMQQQVGMMEKQLEFANTSADTEKKRADALLARANAAEKSQEIAANQIVTGIKPAI